MQLRGAGRPPGRPRQPHRERWATGRDSHGIGRKSWTIETEGTTYRFSRGAPWRHEETLYDDGRRLGSVKRTHLWRGDAAADLPGIPRVVEVFAIAVALSRWEADAAPTG